MKKIDWFDAVSGVCITILTAIIVFIIGCFIALAIRTPKSTFDTSALETWCGESVGEIRMVSAWQKTDDIVEDETGELWSVDVPLSNEDFYLLWIDDMGTPMVEDDEIIKVWTEAHS